MHVLYVCIIYTYTHTLHIEQYHGTNTTTIIYLGGKAKMMYFDILTIGAIFEKI